MLHQVVTFDEKWKKLPSLIISYKVIRCTENTFTRYYDNFDFFDFLKIYYIYFFTFFKIQHQAKICQKTFCFPFVLESLWPGVTIYPKCYI